MEDSEAVQVPADPPLRLVIRGVLWTLLKWGVLAFALWMFTRLVKRIDWAAVRDAIGQLTLWQMAVLLVFVALRQLFTSLPLAFFVPGLPIPKAVQNDLVGNLVATVAPAPSDIVVRMSLFRSWNVDVAKGLAGLVLNSLFFYVARLAAPVLGFLLLWSILGADATFGWTALTSGIAALVLVIAMVVGMRSSASAAALGRLIGRLLTKIRSSWSGPEVMEARLVEFHANIADRLRTRWPYAGSASLGQVLTEASLLLLAVRFVGVGASDAPTLLIYACFLVAYPMTALPFIGLGVLDAALISLISERSAADASELVAALVVWRVCVQLVPLAVGATTFLVWRIRGKAPVTVAE